MERMKQFVQEYDLLKGQTIIDVGAYDLNGSYRVLFKDSTSKYWATDIIEGGGVDFLVGSEQWGKMKGKADAVICGQTLEHCQDIPSLLNQMLDLLKPGGLLCVIAPSAGHPHHPTWSQHFPIGEMTRYVKGAGFEILTCTIDPTPEWHDCCCVARKPRERNVNK
jgi:SAM-dependent methyltransferase